MSTTLLRAKWVAPLDQPIIANGGMIIEGERIVEVGDARSLRADRVEDFGDAVILPGLVNAHTHLELSDCSPGEACDNFTDWIVGVARRPRRDADGAKDATLSGIAQCARFGVTSVGDISQQVGITRPLLRDSPMRGVSYGEVIGLGARRSRFEELLLLALDRTYETGHFKIGLTPHAPYTVEMPDYLRCLDIAREKHLPLATHLAEISHEQEFLEEHTGELRRMWEAFRPWQEPVETFRGSPIHFAKEIGLLDYPTLLAHVNYCNDEELDLLARGNASVVYCPRTHHFFGHAPHRFREMLARGINVAIGTDSCASSPDLNIVDDLRLVHRNAPELSAQTLWEMVTTRGAIAIQQQNAIGSLTAGKLADFVVFPATSGDPLNEILETNVFPIATSPTFASRD